MSENTLLEARKAKFYYVREHVSPYPERYARTHELCEACRTGCRMCVLQGV